MSKKVHARNDDYKKRSAHLSNLSDKDLKDKFWSLIGEVVDPLIKLSKEETSASVERSVLLRMGFSSLEAGEIVKLVSEKGYLSKGAGHCVYVVSTKLNKSIRDAGLSLMNNENWDIVEERFGA